MKLSNKQARFIVLSSTGLHNAHPASCNSKTLHNLITFLGYVQQDPLQVVARAHDHILWSRNKHYRPPMLDTLMEKHRLVFEHFCHDACVLPMETLPYWKQQFVRKNKLFTSNKSRNTLLKPNGQKALLSRISNEGALCSRDFKTVDKNIEKLAWEKPAHKQTLDYLWLVGKLAVSKRVKFTKYYDLAERIYPQSLLDKKISDDERMVWLVTQALNRLGFATFAEIQRFWETFNLDELKQWSQKDSLFLHDIAIESYNGEFTSAKTLEANIGNVSNLPALSKRLRIINPFDPIIRDRNRLERLFGFEYRIEIYVPPDKRQYGYYVYPLLEYDTFVGRIEVRHNRERNTLCVDNLWHEPKVKFGKQRLDKLRIELDRLKRFCGAESVDWLQ